MVLDAPQRRLLVDWQKKFSLDFTEGEGVNGTGGGTVGGTFTVRPWLTLQGSAGQKSLLSWNDPVGGVEGRIWVGSMPRRWTVDDFSLHAPLCKWKGRWEPVRIK